MGDNNRGRGCEICRYLYSNFKQFHKKRISNFTTTLGNYNINMLLYSNSRQLHNSGLQLYYISRQFHNIDTLGSYVSLVDGDELGCHAWQC
jgi:hypothetical protein